MKIEIINHKALETLLSASDAASRADGDSGSGILACDGCGCDTGSDWVNQVCPAPEWVVGWKKATC